MSLEASYFDGRSSRRQAVRLRALDSCLLLQGSDCGERRIPAADILVSERQGKAPRTLRFAGEHGFCEVADGAELDLLLGELGCRASVVVRLQSRWRWALGSLVGIVFIFVAGYLWGLPWGAKAVAPHVPVAAMRPVSEMAVEQLDKYLLRPSLLPEQRREKLQNDFRKIVETSPDLLPYSNYISLGFRSAPKLGPNAFALPDGQIILLDELAVMYDDEEILAVLAHELGHFSGRHGIRQLIQGSVIAAVTAAWFGDISLAAVTLSNVALSSGYSRDMEREADDYAAKLLNTQGKSPELLARVLEKMEEEYQKKISSPSDKAPDAADESDKFMDWISSHPNTAERIRRLRRQESGIRDQA